jgi:6,7-dimethyl-8-ribityllumazine synthase
VSNPYWPGERGTEAAPEGQVSTDEQSAGSTEPDEAVSESVAADIRAEEVRSDSDETSAPGVDAADEAQPEEDGEQAEEPPDEPTDEEEPLPGLRLAGHAPGELELPDGVAVLEGSAGGGRRGVGIVASRFNGEITNRLLANAFAELERAGVGLDAVTVVPVPGAFELPLAAMALAKTRRFSCIVALGCVIRGETPHFDYVAGEAASGLQLAALETGVPVAFGVLTVNEIEQAWERVDKGAEAVRTALEMADLFAQLRAAAQQTAR